MLLLMLLMMLLVITVVVVVPPLAGRLESVLAVVPLEDLQVGPQNVPHEGGGAGEEVRLADLTELSALHLKTGGPCSLETLQAELPGGPGQPVRSVDLAPGPRVPGYSQLTAVVAPATVGGGQDLARAETGHARQGLTVWLRDVTDAGDLPHAPVVVLLPHHQGLQGLRLDAGLAGGLAGGWVEILAGRTVELHGGEVETGTGTGVVGTQRAGAAHLVRSGHCYSQSATGSVV